MWLLGKITCLKHQCISFHKLRRNRELAVTVSFCYYYFGKIVNKREDWMQENLGNLSVLANWFRSDYSEVLYPLVNTRLVTYIFKWMSDRAVGSLYTECNNFQFWPSHWSWFRNKTRFVRIQCNRFSVPWICNSCLLLLYPSHHRILWFKKRDRKRNWEVIMRTIISNTAMKSTIWP